MQKSVVLFDLFSVMSIGENNGIIMHTKTITCWKLKSHLLCTKADLITIQGKVEKE